jgi:hypothetical protein
MRSNLGRSSGADNDGVFLNTPMSAMRTGPEMAQPFAKAQLDRLKELQKAYSWGQPQPGADTPAINPTSLVNNQHSGSISLIPPGPTSPNDSQAPALRQDGAANLSNGSDPISSHHTGSFGHSLPPQPAVDELDFYNPAAALDALPLPDLSDLLLDIPDMFGELEVPSLEQLVQDIGAAEAELMSTAGLPARFGFLSSDGVGGTGAGGQTLLRSQTMPAPSNLPLPPKPATKIRLRRKSAARQGSLPVDDGLPQQQPATQSGASSGSGGSAGDAGGRRKRKPTALETQVETVPAPSTSLQQPEAAVPVLSPFASALGVTPNGWGSNAGSEELNNLSRHPSKKIEVDYILDDDALLERVGNDKSTFAGISSSTPKHTQNSDIVNLAPAQSLPDRHWLSPAAAIHAVHASRPLFVKSKRP